MGYHVNRQGYRAPSAHLPNASAKLWSGCGTTSARTNNNKITSPTPSAYATFRIRTAWNSASIFLTTASTRTSAQKLVTFNSSSSLRMAARNSSSARPPVGAISFRALKKALSIRNSASSIALSSTRVPSFTPYLSRPPLTRLSTFAWAANFFRGVTPRDGAVCRESSRIASRNAV